MATRKSILAPAAPQGSESEQWIPVKGFPGYDVSTLGRVRTWRDFKGNAYGRAIPHVLKYKILKKRGSYLAVQLIRDGRYHTKVVHLLVMDAFAEPCPEGMECRHLDGNSQNPRRDNLGWGTSAQNHADKKLHGTSNTGESNPAAKLTEQDVLEIRSLLSAGVSQSRIAKSFGITQSAVCGINTGSLWGHVR